MKKLLLAILVIFSTVTINAAEWRTVVRVVDGDTVELDGKEKVRLIGVDTPEKHESEKLTHDAKETGVDAKMIQQLGELASLYTKMLCEGKKVWLEFDTQDKDKYGRTLAYLHLEDGKVVNEEIIKAGYGTAYTKYPFKYMEKYRKLGTEARENGKGLYSAKLPQSTAPPVTKDSQKQTTNEDDANITVYVTKTGSKYHRAGCSYLRKSSIPMKLSDAKKNYGPCSRCHPPQ